MHTVGAAKQYFAIVLAAAFVPGTIRVLWQESRAG
jgi:hypothetical protein